ncbi:MAG: hypothetical protein V4515_03485 [Chloroflexota bacterium]
MAPRPPARVQHHPRAVLFNLYLALVVLACGPAIASPSGEPPIGSPSPGSVTLAPDAKAIYQTIARQVSTIRQLEAPDRVEPVVIDGPTLLRNLQAEFNDANPAEEIAKSERLLRIMGLLGADISLAQAYLDLQGSQVIGYYDPKVKELFIVSRDGALGAIEEVTYAHEFTHELQDRRFNLDSLGLDTIKDDSDRALAILSLVEGDAVSAQIAWMTANLTAAQLGEVAAQASDPAMLAVLARTPRILLETSLFPYQAGPGFVARLQARGGYPSVNAAYGNPPVSTEQILHPDADATTLAPIAMVVPADLAARLGPDWSVAARDTFGELQTRVWLREGGVAGDVARLAAEGWGGDRLVLMDGPDGAAVVVWTTAWDSVQDARAFESAARTALGGLRLDARLASSGVRVAIAIRSAAAPDRSTAAPDDATLVTVLEALIRS